LRDFLTQRIVVPAGIESSLSAGEDPTMPLEKQASKRKRATKGAAWALGTAGLTFGLAGGASASTTPTADAPQKLNFTPRGFPVSR